MRRSLGWYKNENDKLAHANRRLEQEVRDLRLEIYRLNNVQLTISEVERSERSKSIEKLNELKAQFDSLMEKEREASGYIKASTVICHINAIMHRAASASEESVKESNELVEEFLTKLLTIMEKEPDYNPSWAYNGPLQTKEIKNKIMQQFLYVCKFLQKTKSAMDAENILKAVSNLL